MSCPATFMPDPEAFEAGLAAVPRGDGTPAIREVAVLPSGGINANFRVVTDRGEFVLRMAGIGGRAELLGVDRQRERLLHGLAADAGLAPPVLAAAVDGRWQVRPFVPGRHWSGDEFDSPRQIERLGERLRRLQSIVPPTLVPFDPLALLGRWCDVLVQHSPEERASLCAMLEGARAAIGRIDVSRRKPCLVHSDLHGENIVDGDELCFIDWEYAQVADPLCELGSLIAAHAQLERHADELLAAAGLAGRASHEEVAAWTTVYRCLNSFWRRLAWAP